MAFGLTNLTAEISHYLTHHIIIHLNHDDISPRTIREDSLTAIRYRQNLTLIWLNSL